MAYLKREGNILLKPVEWSSIDNGLKFKFVTKEDEECSGLLNFTKKDGSENESIALVSAAFEKGEFLLMEVKASPDGKYFNAKWAVTPKAGGSSSTGNPSFAELKKYMDSRKTAKPAAAEPAYPADSVPF
jgi:hypothetical protein